MKVLVTGGGGFIGSHIVDALVDEGIDTVSVDVFSPAAHLRPPEYLNPAADHRRVSMTDLESLTRALDGVDAVCHQAARVGLGVDFDDVVDYVNDNSSGTATLLKALHRVGFAGRFVQASSMVVYGEGAYTCDEHGGVAPAPRRATDLEAGVFEPTCPVCGHPLTPALVTEEAILDPRNVYAATKVNQEHLSWCFARTSGADVVNLRYHNVYGPRMPRDTPYAGVASIVRSALEAERPPRVFEDGGQRRDFVHVTDVARANVLALTTGRTVAGAYNIASGRPCTIAEMASLVAEGFGADAPPPIVTAEYRLGDVRHITASPARAHEVFGFTATVPYEVGLREFATTPMRGSVA